VSEGGPPAIPPVPREEPPAGSVSGLQSFYDRAGGVLVPVAAAFLAFLVATHNPDLARKAERGYRLVEGRAREISGEANAIG